MAIKVSKKDVTAKKTEKKATAKSSGKKKKNQTGFFMKRMEYVAKLLLEQKWLDEEIIEKTNDEFPESKLALNQKEIGRARWMLYHDKIPSVSIDGDRSKCQRIYEMEDGTRIKKADKPKPKYSSAKKEQTEKMLDKYGLGSDTDSKDRSAKKKTAKTK